MNVLITGGAGFIGSNLARYINKNLPHYSIVIFDKFNDQSKLDNGNYKYLGDYNNLIGINAEIIIGDITSEIDINRLYEHNFDVIYHLAAISDTRASNQNELFLNNIVPTYSFIKMAKKMDAKLVYASSAAVYGSSKECKYGCESPENAYAFSKYCMDKMIINLNPEKGPNKGITGLRFFNVYGPGEDYKFKTSSTINQFFKQAKSNKEIVLFEGSDKIYRDFIFIDDVVEMIYLSSLSLETKVFNVGTGIPRTFQDIADEVIKLIGSNIRIKLIKNPYKSGYQYFTKADMEETIKNLNYTPKYTLEQGIRNYYSCLENLK